MNQKKQVTLRVEGRDVSVSNLDKVMYPEVGFTKGQVIDYYTRVASYILPHLKDRPITMKRFPNGINGQYIYEKNTPSFTPDWIKTYRIPSSREKSIINYILINDFLVNHFLNPPLKFHSKNYFNQPVVTTRAPM